MSFGKSIFEPGDRFAYNIMNGQLQVYDRESVQTFDLRTWKSGELATWSGNKYNKIRSTANSAGDSLKTSRLKLAGQQFYGQFVTAIVGDQLYVK
jgi:hypothetical protein